MSSILLKLINNASNLTKGNHDRDGVWIFDHKWHIFFTISNDLRFQRLNTVFNHISKGLEVCQKSTPHMRVAFSPLFPLFGNVIKHGLSCLIYYFPASDEATFDLLVCFSDEQNLFLRYIIMCKK